MADVADDISVQLVKAIELPKDDVASRLSELLNHNSAFSGSSQPLSTAVIPSAAVWSLDDELDSDTLASEPFDDGISLVLTRRDRMRLAGLSHLADWDTDEDAHSNYAKVTKDNTSPRGRPTKRVRFRDDNDLEEATRALFEEVIDETAYTADDSRVLFASPPGSHVSVGHCGSSFTQMACDAEGFDGPAADGNLFLDMDLIHCGRDDLDFPSDPSGVPGPSAFPIPLQSHDYALTPASPEPSQITHINELPAADELSPGHPSRSFRSSPSAPVGCGPLASTGVVPAAISGSLSDPYPASEAMVNEDGLQVSTSFATTSTPGISTRQSLAQYLALCGKVSVSRPDILTPPCPETSESAIPVHQAQAAPSSGLRDAPAELFDDNTLVLPARYTRPDTKHTYMASLSLVQKRALVRALGSYCAVDLVEREHLGGSSASPGPTSGSEDLVLDCDTAVLFSSLELLPARAAGLLALLARLSWRYARLLVVFECYPSAWDCSGGAATARMGADRPVASVWSPPVVKAVRNLKRDLAISDGLQTKREACLVEYALANSPEEGAAFARIYGDLAETQDATGGDAWGQRLWLTYDERDVSVLLLHLHAARISRVLLTICMGAGRI